MIRVEFKDLVVGNIYYDVDNPIVVPGKFKLIEKNGDYATFIGLSNCNVYDPNKDGTYVFKSMYFYREEFKFGK